MFKKKKYRTEAEHTQAFDFFLPFRVCINKNRGTYEESGTTEMEGWACNKKILGVKTLCSGVNILAEHTYGQEQI